MNNLSDFIIEKFKINKNTIIKSELQDCYICCPIGDLYFLMRKEFEDFLISCNEKPQLFILHKDDIKKYIKKYYKNSNLCLYEIPEKYSTFKEVSLAYKKKEFGTGDLKKCDKNTII